MNVIVVAVAVVDVIVVFVAAGVLSQILALATQKHCTAMCQCFTTRVTHEQYGNVRVQLVQQAKRVA